MRDPIATLRDWMAEAETHGERLPEAMALATVGSDGRPSLRMVLLRGVDERGLRFYTHYESRKARELEGNPHAALLFHWKSLARQIRFEGKVERTSAADSDAYFASRARGSQLSAAVSPQSRVIDGIETLAARRQALATELEGKPVPRPEQWGGYRLLPESAELWIEGSDRLHERTLLVRCDGGWTETTLAP